MAQFDGKVALVTGGGSGIGRAAILLLARDGAKVLVSDIADESGNETVQAVKKAGGEAAFVRTDVSNPDDCRKMVEAALSQFGRLDIAVNNAGIGGESNTVADYSVEGWQKVISINLNAVFYCMKFQIPAMLKNGSGSIINMASILGTVGFPNSPAYVASKHGVVGLTKAAAVEYANQGVRVNAIGPGFIQTPMIQQLEADKQANEMLVSLHPIGRLGKAEEVAELIIWLASDKASYVSGSYYNVDGGYLAR